ncbi:MAG TPA: polysaccharide pyruvyl transferase family protein [Thermoanaerobaculia bacterium]|nr:polysaccharide pyruvyl transferase family protein [Thermoanaerobaculia bacterium]
MSANGEGAGAKKRVLFSGYFGAGNLGDEAILSATLARFHAQFGDTLDPIVESRDPVATRRSQGAITTVRPELLLLSEAIRSSDLVVWGGGGLLQDIWHFPVEDLFRNPRAGIPWYVRVPLLSAFWGVPCILYAQGIGPVEHAESRRLIAVVANSLPAITVRDEPSAALLRECGVTAPITVTADPAFALRIEAGQIPAQMRAHGLDSLPRPLAALVPRLPPGEETDWIEPYVRGVDRWLEASGGSVAFLPFDQGRARDVGICDGLRRRMARPDRAVVVERIEKPAGALALLGGCDLVLATRLHGVILAAVAGTPVAALDYDPKVAAAAADLDVPVLPLHSIREQSIFEAMSALAAEPERRREALAGRIEYLRSREEWNVRRAAALLARPASSRSPDDSSRELQEAKDFLSIASRQLAVASRELSESRAREADVAVELARVSEEFERWKSSRTGRIQQATWDLSARLLPEGSRRRQIYRRLRGLPEPLPPSEIPARDSSPSEPPGPRDFPGELAAFEERLLHAPKVPVVAIFSATRLREDEGQRPTQFALELARRGTAVVFVFWRWSADEPSPQDRLESRIFQVPIDVVASDPDILFRRFRGFPRRVVFEFPHPSFLEPLAAANAEGWTTVYDVLDDWEDFHRVGQAAWYREGFERHLAGTSGVVTAVHPLLVERAAALGARAPILVPNGVRTEIAAVGTRRRLRRGRVTVGYFGYLAGAWFDWEIVAAAARARPRWVFHLIGYGGSAEGVELPENVVLHGRVAQSELASYAACWDVGIVPFKESRLAAGADPIKTYEYLAMGLPVVVTGVFPPRGAEAHVTRAGSADEFVAAIEKGGRTRRRRADRRDFAKGCTWARRLDALLDAAGGFEREDPERRALFGAPE